MKPIMRRGIGGLRGVLRMALSSSAFIDYLAPQL
jgi:hypothetical protein